MDEVIPFLPIPDDHRHLDVTVVLREYVNRVLYDPDDGYFVRHRLPDSLIAEPARLPFRDLRNEADLKSAVVRWLHLTRSAWATPSTTYSPHYAHAICAYACELWQRQHPGVPLTVVEMGAGTGGFAAEFLARLRAAHPREYATVRYRVCEISATLAAAQRRRLAEHIAEGRCEVTHTSALQPAVRCDDPCLVLALEVADNLPHDCVLAAGAGGAEPSVPTPPGHPLERRVRTFRNCAGDAVAEELCMPLADPLLLQTLERSGALHAAGRAGEAAARDATRRRWGRERGWFEAEWSAHLRRGLGEAALGLSFHSEQYVATGLSLLFGALRANFPRHELLLADFSSLPSRVHGAGAPVVQRRRAFFAGGAWNPTAHECLNVPVGTCDIFFPTHFASAAALYRAATGRRARHDDHGAFLARFAPSEALAATTLADGWCALSGDFRNCRVLTTAGAFDDEPPRERPPSVMQQLRAAVGTPTEE